MTSQRRSLGAALLLGAAALQMLSASPALAGDSYSNPFDVPPREGWSDTVVKASPSGEQFLGSFGNQTVSLTLTNLQEHTHAVIALDLYVIGGWAGSAGDSPNSFELLVDQSREIMRATFSNDDGVTGRPQTYPEGNNQIPELPRRGAFRTNSLGYTDQTGRPADSTYRLVFNVKHSGSTLVLSFAGAGLPDDPTIMWGIDNVYVATYTMDLDPVPGAFEPAGTEWASFDGAAAASLGVNPQRPFTIPSGGPGAPSGTPRNDPPPPPPPDSPVIPTPGSATVLALAAGQLLRRPRRTLPASPNHLGFPELPDASRDPASRAA
jgi:hypothetical protein